VIGVITSPQEAKPETKKGPLPLAIGITGHRDLRQQDYAILEEKVRSIFSDLQARYPHSPLVFLSPLAEGADRLVARVALEQGIRLFVPLPMRRELYEQDFATEASRAEFRELSAKAERQFELPLVTGNTEENIRECGEQRNRQYAAVGAYLALHTQIFIALWDGNVEEAHKTGGTAQIVRFNLEGVPEPYTPPRSLLDLPEKGPVYHILSPREGSPLPPGELFELRVLYPEGTDADSYNRINERIETFNRDAVELAPVVEREGKVSKGYLLPEETAKDLPPALNASLDCYAVADVLAIQFQQRTTTALNRVFICVFIAALSFNLFHSLPHPQPPGGHATEHSTSAAHADTPHTATPHAPAPRAAAPRAGTHTMDARETTTHPEAGAHSGTVPQSEAHSSDMRESDTHQGDAHEAAQTSAESSWLADIGQIPWFLVLFLGVSIFSNLVLHRRAARGDYQNKYQDYRALAEGMRMQVFWRLSGLRDSVADHYLGRQRGELEWIRDAIRVWNITADADSGAISSPSPQQQRDWIKLAQARWVEDQRKYYARKTHREQEELEHDEQRIDRLIRFSVGMALVLLVILVAPILLPLPWMEALKHKIEDPWTHGIYMVALVMPAVGAGLLHGYNQYMARSEHAKQFGRMSVLFDIAARQLSELLAADNYAAAQVLMRELGKESLQENGDWVLLHRERPLEVPHAA
jgi:hypothetical protein